MRNKPARSGRNLSGKLVLAALVHQVTCPEEKEEKVVEEEEEAEAEIDEGSKCNKKGAHDAHGGAGGGGGGLRRLGRLLFSGRRKTSQPAHLIDNNNNSNNYNNNSAAIDTKQTSDDGEQVIEFKFDLIVENRLLHRAGPDANQVMGGGDRRLGESLDELVEAFALHSNDVCLMSLGRPAETVSVGRLRREWRAAAGQTDYAGSLAAHALAYSFQLLEEAHQGRPGESDDGDGSNYYSIELGATLLAASSPSNRSSPARFAFVDLLGDANCDERRDNCSVDCSSAAQARETLAKLTGRLGQLLSGDQHQDKRLLIFHLKLKRRINGGLFSNRMCVIDFQPKFTEMHSIFESIFNGQALAYLKQRQLQLQRPSSKHHQVASPEPGEPSLVLLEAEWALYRHLSAALIRTLVVVHVRKLSSPSPEVSPRERQFADRLMLDNLCLLEFAHSIQRASGQRLRRRKRHLRSHLASSTTSVASNQSATTCLASNWAAYRPLESAARTGSRSLRSRCQRRAMDIGLMSRRTCHNRRLHLERPNLSGPELTGTESSSLSTTSSGSRRPLTRGYASPTGRPTPLSLANTSLNLNLNSDDSDSVTSANLISCSSVASYLLQQQQQQQQNGSLRCWQSSVTETERAQIELASTLSLAGAQPQAFGGRTRASSVIQIDCPSTTTTTTTSLTTSTSRRRRRPEEDNASDVEENSSVAVAEPPKQLKLEEFLTQLSSIISPIRAPQLAAARLNHGAGADGRQVEATGGGGEEDEDCKSHSSILEHLSSLALESNARLNNRQRVHDYLAPDVAKENDALQVGGQPDDDDDDDGGGEGEGEEEDRRQTPTTGHLQRLLNSSVQLQRKGSPRVAVLRNQHPAGLEHRLLAAEAVVVSPSSSSGVSAQSATSNCDSTSSCGSSLSTAPPPPPPLPPLAGTGRQPDLYASVANKHHSHIKT